MPQRYITFCPIEVVHGATSTASSSSFVGRPASSSLPPGTASSSLSTVPGTTTIPFGSVKATEKSQSPTQNAPNQNTDSGHHQNPPVTKIAVPVAVLVSILVLISLFWSRQRKRNRAKFWPLGYFGARKASTNEAHERETRQGCSEADPPHDGVQERSEPQGIELAAVAEAKELETPIAELESPNLSRPSPELFRKNVS